MRDTCLNPLMCDSEADMGSSKTPEPFGMLTHLVQRIMQGQ